MKATLYVPADWRQDPHYARLWEGSFCADIGQKILQGLTQSAELYEELPPLLPVTVEWVENRANPKNCEPCLVIKTDGVRHHRIRMDQDQAAARLVIGLSDSELAQLIPECRIRFYITFECQCALTTM